MSKQWSFPMSHYITEVSKLKNWQYISEHGILFKMSFNTKLKMHGYEKYVGSSYNTIISLQLLWKSIHLRKKLITD